MADDAVVLNKQDAPFVDDEFDSGEADIYPGHFLELSDATTAIKSATEDDEGRGLMVGLAFDPEYVKGEAYPNGTRLRCYYVPVGGRVDARLAAGGDLTASADADISAGDILAEVNLGAVAHVSASTSGGARYMALEASDNSGASAGVGNQVHIEVVRIA
jgi:hypothetical protein